MQISDSIFDQEKSVLNIVLFVKIVKFGHRQASVPQPYHCLISWMIAVKVTFIKPMSINKSMHSPLQIFCITCYKYLLIHILTIFAKVNLLHLDLLEKEYFMYILHITKSKHNIVILNSVIIILCRLTFYVPQL